MSDVPARVAPASMRICSWNVNGLRACARKGFSGWLRRTGADVVAVQEVRARPEQLPRSLAKPRGWHVAFHPAARPGYSGVAIFSRRPPDAVDTTLGHAGIDAEGRFLLARFGALTVVSAYFPNGNGIDRDNSRVPFKLRFYRRVFDRLRPALRGGGRVLVMGDLNTAHREIDLARPRQNLLTSGFLPEERRELDRWMRAGWADTFRAFDARPGRYTWWSQRQGVRERNIGWRLDYVLATPAAMEHVLGASIHHRVRGSDHCPVSVVLERSVLDGAPRGRGRSPEARARPSR